MVKECLKDSRFAYRFGISKGIAPLIDHIHLGEIKSNDLCLRFLESIIQAFPEIIYINFWNSDIDQRIFNVLMKTSKGIE
jgi:hypothetical protein